ncbi:MAG: transporter substrate-binding protein [Gammaproteobacteria bacterium]|nr:transporter substrate-binding protein [Gammaproteobacteria bacterium]
MAEKTVKLGLMPPLSGLVGIYGSDISHAGQVACQEINENGGVLGLPLELIIEDDGSLPDSAVLAAEKLVVEHKCVAIIGNLLSNSRISVAYRVAEPHKIPYLNFSFYEGSILSRYFFHYAALPNQQIDHMIPYMKNTYGPRMFFAGNNYEWPRGSIHAAKKILAIAGGTVVGEEYCPIGVSKDTIERLLDDVEKEAPDVFVPYFAGADQVLLLTRFTERGLKEKMAVVMGHYDEMMASQLAPEVREGFYSSNTYFMTIDTPENKNYLTRLSKLSDIDGIWPYGNGILTNFGEGTYACVKAFAKAANEAGSLESEALVEALRRGVVESPQGLIHMNSEHHHAKVNTYLSRCDRDGVFQIIEKFGAIDPVLPERYNHQRITQDITLEEEIRLQARMLGQLSEAVLLFDAQDRCVIHANAGAERMFGYKKGGMLGLHLAKFNDPFGDDSYSIYGEIIHALERKGEWHGDIRNARSDGNLFWCASSVSAFTHPVYGEVWMAVHRDIDDKKTAEADLREASMLNEKIIGESPIGIAIYDESGQCVAANDAIARMVGASHEDVLAQNYNTVQSWKESGLLSLVKRALANNQREHMEANVTTTFGNSVFFDFRIVPFDMQEKLFLLLMADDVTERKETENALIRSEAMLEKAQQIAQLGHWRYDPELNEVSGSETLYELFGIDRNVSVLDHFFDSVHPDDRGKVAVLLPTALETGKGWDIEYRIYGKEQQIKWVHTVGDVVTDMQGNVKEVIGTVQDINIRKLAQAELAKHRDHLEEMVKERTRALHEAQDELVRSERLATLGQLTATVSHELRNPLGAIRPALYYLKKRFFDVDDERATVALQRIDRNVARCDHIIDELLDFTRITDLDRQSTNIDAWLKEIVNEMVIPAKISVSVEPCLQGLEVSVDSNRLRRAVINVVENACHALLDETKEAGHMENRQLRISTNNLEEKVSISIADNGCGIPESILEKVFEPLFSTKGFGVGLGMSAVKQIMEQHGGGISIQSKEGEGTTVELWLPKSESVAYSNRSVA